MQSTIVRRLGAAISVSALALTLATVPTSASESSQPFTTDSSVPEDRPNARLATGADLAGSSASRSSGAVAAPGYANGNVTQVKAYSTSTSHPDSALINHPDENYIDVDVWVSDPDEIVDGLGLYVSVDGKKTGPLDLWYDEDLDVTFVIVPDSVGLGKAEFYGTMIYYAEGSDKAATWDSTDSNYFYVRRDVYFEANAEVELSVSGKTKTFTVEDMGIYSPSAHNFRALSSIKLQYKTSDGWKTKKTIYLDDDGYGTYSFVRTSKFYYRIISGQNSTWIGYNQSFPKI